MQENESTLLSQKKQLHYEIEDANDTTMITLIGRALSSPIRIEILRELNKKPMLLSQIAKEFDLPISSAAFHMKALEDAKLVTYEFSTKRKGTFKWYSYSIKKDLVIALRKAEGVKNTLNTFTQTISIGDYIDAKFPLRCGIASEKEHSMENEPHKVFINERKNAQLIWFSPIGYLTYAIPNDYAQKGRLAEIELSLEICSEAMGFNEDYPSDVTFWINDIELYTWTCPGDYGDRYGKFTPPWWFPESTKYGRLINISIKEKGVFFNEQLVNKKLNLQSLALAEGNKTSFKIGVKEDAKHQGGLNVFGEKFGEFNQAINFTARYKN